MPHDHHRKTERRQAPVAGMIVAEALYDTNALLEVAGIGDHKLMELRRQKRITPHRLDGHGRAWYWGRDIIALIVAGSERAERKAS